MNFPLMPVQGSEMARQTDLLYWALIGLSAVIVLGLLIPIVVFLFKYRAEKPADRRPRALPQLRIELTWTLLPTLIMMGIFAWGAEHYFALARPPADAMELNVIGKQWMWKIQHPEGAREINELHVPLGRNIKLTMTSQDVIHSFFIPALRIKQDVVPGRYTTTWFNANREGTYQLF